MALKRKKRKVLKENLATLEPPKSQEAPPKKDTSSKSAEYLISHNADLVKSLISSEVWTTVVFPLISEGIYSVSGRFTNGRFYSGELARQTSNKEFLTGYQCALTELYNRINDFVLAKEKLLKDKNEQELAKRQPIINPFMEEEDE